MSCRLIVTTELAAGCTVVLKPSPETVLDAMLFRRGCRRLSTIAQEEIFGPVLSAIRYTDTDDAIRIANDSDYGLGGSIWTSDPDRGQIMMIWHRGYP